MQDNELHVSAGPWDLGLVNAVSEHEIPLNGLLNATDVNIDRDGVATTRKKWALLESANYHSIFEHNGIIYAGRDNEVGVAGDDAFHAIASVAGPMDWAVLEEAPVYTDFDTIRTIEHGVPVPLSAGYYEDDEEDEYQLQQLPGGSEIYAWRGRLIVVRGNSLLWSEPLRYGVYSAARNFIRFDERIMWAQPIRTGIYVGLRNSVLFLAGADPNQFIITTVGGKSAPGVSATYDNRHSGEGGEQVALWFTEVGIAIGQSSGSVVYPQAERLKGLPLHPGKMVIEDDRVFIFTTQEH